jgi:hypothetical protein
VVGTGFLVNRVALMRVACWVWVPGLIWLAFGLLGWVQHYDPRWHGGCSVGQDVVNAFFLVDSRKCGGGDEGLNWLVFTFPASNSVAYAVGAWIALWVGRRMRKNAAAADSS